MSRTGRDSGGTNLEKPARVLVARFKVDTTKSKAAIGFDLAGFPPHPFTVRGECEAWTDQIGNFHTATSSSDDFTVPLGQLYGEDLFPDPAGIRIGRMSH